MKVFELKNGVKLQSYSNGSYAYWSDSYKGWKNIHKELAEALIKGNRK